MARVCKECAKKGEKIYLRLLRRTLSMAIYACPKCNKKAIIDRKV